MDNRAIIILRMQRMNADIDLDVPLDISANDLVIALNTAYNLGIDTTDAKNCYLKAENPKALLKGNKSLLDYGVRNGTVVIYTN